MEARLKYEIDKWMRRLEEKREKITAKGKGKGQLTLADDYISDSKHFLSESQLIESFEALVYAWAIIETLERLNLVEGI